MIVLMELAGTEKPKTTQLLEIWKNYITQLFEDEIQLSKFENIEWKI